MKKSPADAPAKPSVQVLERMFQLIDVLASREEAMSLKELSEVSGLHPSTAHRILNGKRIDNDLANWQPSPWVFSSPTAADGRLQEPRKAHNRALASAGLPELSIHGLRRSFGTLAEWVECPAGISAQIMGHKPSATAEKHYRRRPLDLLRQWHTKIEGWILEQAGIEQPSEEAQPGLRAVNA